MLFYLLNTYKRTQLDSANISLISSLLQQTLLLRGSDSISLFDFNKTEGEKSRLGNMQMLSMKLYSKSGSNSIN